MAELDRSGGLQAHQDDSSEPGGLCERQGTSLSQGSSRLANSSLGTHYDPTVQLPKTSQTLEKLGLYVEYTGFKCS